MTVDEAMKLHTNDEEQCDMNSDGCVLAAEVRRFREREALVQDLLEAIRTCSDGPELDELAKRVREATQP